jgi:hypothetical protein
MKLVQRPTSCAAALLIAVLCCAAQQAAAKEEFGPTINDFCTANDRVPAEPYGSVFPEQCQLCHMADTFDKKASHRVQPNWDEFVAASTRFGGDGDFSFFCPAPLGNRPPVLDPIGDRSTDEGVQLAFVLSASDPDGDALHFQATDLPEGAELIDHNDGTAGFAWTPGAGTTGSYSVAFQVTDAGSPAESDAETITISVGNVNHPPVLEAVGSHVVYEGAPFAISVAAGDPDVDALAFAVDGLPLDGALVDRGDGSADFGWSPAVGSAGSYPLTVRVTDAGVPALGDSEDVTVTVIARPPGALYVKKAKLSSKGTLKLKGAGAGASASVEILTVDGLALAPMATVPANPKGKFKLKSQPVLPPCVVAARVGDLVSPPVAVTGAPASCLAP